MTNRPQGVGEISSEWVRRYLVPATETETRVPLESVTGIDTGTGIGDRPKSVKGPGSGTVSGT